MSPRKFLDDDQKQQTKSGIVIYGPRPTPLKVKHNPQIKKPVIIYLRSPKVIHTKPHDFMALVQKLTGRSGSKDKEQQHKKTIEDGYDHLNNNEFYNDSGVAHERNDIMKSKSPMFNTPFNRYVADIPLFTPNSTSDYFFSPQRLLSLSDTVSSSPNKSTSFSPGSLVEFFKRLPEY